MKEKETRPSGGRGLGASRGDGGEGAGERRRIIKIYSSGAPVALA